MSIIEVLLVALALSLDAFAASVCKGCELTRGKAKAAAKVGLYFGGFQTVMPLIGFLLGERFLSYISTYDHWLAVILLAVLGIKMIISARRFEPPEVKTGFTHKELLPLAVATSIDALAVGISMSVVSAMPLYVTVTIIGVVTFGVCFVGVFIGTRVGAKLQGYATLAGGVALLIIGFKILAEHMGWFLGR